MKAKTTKKTARRAGSTVRKAAEQQGRRAGPRRAQRPGSAGEVLRDTWHSTLAALTTAEQEVEKQVQAAPEDEPASRPGTRPACCASWGRAPSVERRKALKELEARLADAAGADGEGAQGAWAGRWARPCTGALAAPQHPEPPRGRGAHAARSTSSSRKIDGFRRPRSAGGAPAEPAGR